MDGQQKAPPALNLIQCGGCGRMIPKRALSCIKCGEASPDLHPEIRKILKSRLQFSRMTGFEINQNLFAGYGESKASGMPSIILGVGLAVLGLRLQEELLYIGFFLIAVGMLSLAIDFIVGARKTFTIRFLENGSFEWTSNDDEHWYELRCYLWPHLRKRYFGIGGAPRRFRLQALPARLGKLNFVDLINAFAVLLATGSFFYGAGEIDWLAAKKSREIPTSAVVAKINQSVVKAGLKTTPEEIQNLKAIGAEIDTRGKRDETILHVAAESGSPELVKTVIQAGADVNAQDFAGKTPLHLSATRGDLPTSISLLEGGADPSVRDRGGRSPIEVAAEKHHPLAPLIMTLPAVPQIALPPPHDPGPPRDDGRVDLASYLFIPESRRTVLELGGTGGIAQTRQLQDRETGPGRWVSQSFRPEDGSALRSISIWQVESDRICRVEAPERSEWECHRRFAREGDPIDGEGIFSRKLATFETPWGLIPNCIELTGSRQKTYCRGYGKIQETAFDTHGAIQSNWQMIAHFSALQPSMTSKRFTQEAGRVSLACSERDAPSCHAWGLGLEFDSDLAKAGEAYRHGCSLKQAKSCFSLGFLELAAKNRVESRIYFDSACRYGDLGSCARVAQLEADLLNFAAARDPLQKACAASHLQSCRILGDLELKLGYDQAAIAAYRAPCQAGWGESCELGALAQAHLDRRNRFPAADASPAPSASPAAPPGGTSP